MLDFSFSEIALVGIVALVVIGPERLPKVARTVGVIVGRVQRYSARVRADIAREVELSELKAAKQSLEETAQTIHQEIQQAGQDAERAVIETREDVLTVHPPKKDGGA